MTEHPAEGVAGAALSAPAQHLSYDITQVCAATGLGRTTIYAAISAGDLIARKYGRRTVVLSEDLAKFLNKLPPVKVPKAHPS